MELIFYPVAILLIISAFVWKKKGSGYLALAGNSVFYISLLHCIFDVSQRLSAGNCGGIADIYPVIKWYYLVMFIVISILNTALIVYKNRAKS